LRTTGTGGFFKCKGFPGGGGGGGSCALASAIVHEATTASNINLIVFILVRFNYIYITINKLKGLTLNSLFYK
jgi:hypothetical protein